MTTAQQDVVQRLTERFDFHDTEYTPDVAEEVNRRLRETCPVAYSEAHGGMWILSRYEDVRAALKDHETFSSGSGVHFPRAAGMPKFSPIDYDPPEHATIRRLMAAPFQTHALRRIEPDVRRLAAGLIGPVAERGEGELVSEFSRPFAIGTLALSIGLSERAQGEIRALTGRMWARMATDADAGGFWPAYRELLSEEIRLAREHQADYYLAELASAEVDGEPISEDLLYSIIVSLCVAGHDNTMNTISRMLFEVAGDPELQAAVRGDPDLIAGLAEETLRRYCPTDRFTRVTTRDVTIDDVTIPAGARVVLLFDAANRDPDKFSDPDEYRPDREGAHQHLSFGYGIHRCMGAQLARMEFRAVLGELAKHPPFRLTEPAPRRFENGRHVMFDKICVSFERGEGTDGD